LYTALGLVAVALLILANGWFVAAEFSFVAARRGRLAADQPTNRRSARAVEVQEQLSFMLSGAQLGITVTSLVVGFIAEPTLGRALRPLVEVTGLPDTASRGIALAIGFVLATMAQMVLGELAPKNLAIARPEPVARAIAPSLWLYLRIASPLVRFFDNSANWMLRRAGVEPVQEHQSGVSVDELDIIVEQSAEQGHLSAQQASLLERALDFGELRAAGAMTPWTRVHSVVDTATGEDLRVAMASGFTRFPVTSPQGDVLAVVHAKDLLSVPLARLTEVTAGQLARPVPIVPEAAGLRMVLRKLRHEATELALVVDEYGSPAGIITLEDLAEELVGDIVDEYDVAGPHPVRDGDGHWLVPADWRPDEIERATGTVLPLGDYDTAAGLVLERLERLAEPGDTVEVDGILIEVTEVADRTIVQLRLRPVGASGTADLPGGVGAQTATGGEPGAGGEPDGGADSGTDDIGGAP
jgi:CBS domain containing-hemolysin-like protein